MKRRWGTSDLRRLRQRLVRVGGVWVHQAWLWRGLLGVACVVALAAASWYVGSAGWRWFKAHPYFAIATIDIEGNHRVRRTELLQWTGLRTGASIWDVSPATIQTRLEHHAWIRRAKVRRLWPHRVRIGVQERRPAALVRLATLNYVDRSGEILGPLRADDSRDFPVITGLEAAEMREFAPVGIHRALQLLRRCQRVGCFDGVSEVHVDPQRGVTIFPLRTAVAVVLGWGSWRQKLARSARVLAAWEGQEGRVAALDVSFPDLVVVKLRAEDHPAAGRSPKPGARV